MADIAGEIWTNTLQADVPDQRWSGSDVPDTYLEDVPDQRWEAVAVEQGGAAPTSTEWLMRALTDPAGVLIYWVSNNAPDYTGVSAPEAVQVPTIVLIRQIT